MFSYFAYGLGIQSALQIPEFIPTTRGEDVSISIDTQHPLETCVPPDVAQQRWSLKLTKEEAIVFLQDVAAFFIHNGRTIVIVPAPGVSEQLIRFYLVGTVMAIVLYQRGFLVLHASVINLHDRAVAFLGISGAGKSSTAAALHAAGHCILADDVAAVTLEAPVPTVAPGFPQIKLSPEIAAYLGHDFDVLVPIHPADEKRGLRMINPFPRSPFPLQRIYTLAYGEFGIEPLNPQEAVIELVRHSRPTTLFHSGGASHFLQCAELAKRVTVCRLTRPRSLDLLPELVKRVEADGAHHSDPITV